MVQVVSDNQDITRELEKICAILKEDGSFLHDQLTVVCDTGNLHIEAPGEVKNGQEIINVSHDALLYLDLFDVVAENDEFVLKDVKAEANDAQRALMESMLAIYNHCDKIRDFKKFGTLNLLQHDRDLLVRLLSEQAVSALEKDVSDNYDVEAFFRTRQLGTKVDDSKELRPAIMPMIDFLNHNINGARFNMRDKDLSVRRQSPRNVSQCFVRYGNYDALDILNTYAFVDESDCFVYARPMTIALEGLGTIAVGLRNKKYVNTKLSQNMKDLAVFFPPFSKSPDGDLLQVGFLRIPNRTSPRALRRVLRAVIGFALEGKFPLNIEEILDSAERQVITSTHAFYEKLESDMMSYEAAPEVAPVIDNIRKVARLQMDRLDAYDFELSKGSAASPFPVA